MASTSARRRTARARRPLPQAADRAMASTLARARRRSTRGPAAQTFFPDEIWEDIFLRLDAAADLARASAACSSFRRIVSDRRFLRRFRSLRPPPVLGFISPSGIPRFVPVQPPHRSAREARALELAADFTFSFVPDHSAWCYRHALDGRVLLSQRISTKTHFEDFVVCDPLHRRYVKIPRILPDDLLAAYDNGMPHRVLPVLVPAGQNDEEESFRIICTVQLKDKVVALVFSSCNQMWRAIIHMICLPPHRFVGTPDYAHGCVYWVVNYMGYSLMLDISEMEFSIIELPPYNFDLEYAIGEAADGRLGFLTIDDGIIDLYCKNWQINGVGIQEWQHNKRITLPKDFGIDYDWVIEGPTWRYLALGAESNHEIYDEAPLKSEQFVLDMKTLHVEKLGTSNDDIYVYPYAGFPPPLALPSI